MLLINHEMDNAIGLPFVSVKDCVSGLTRYLGQRGWKLFEVRLSSNRAKAKDPVPGVHRFDIPRQPFYRGPPIWL
jgi:hypothetical protein